VIWGVGSRTYEAERIDEQRSDGMGQGAEAEDIEVQAGDEEIPYEVAGGQSLNHARSARVSPHALLPVHGAALVVDEHDPDGETVDEDALEHGDDVGVPVETPLARQLGIVARSKGAGDDGRERPEDDRVEESGGEDLVDVQRERGEAEALAPWLGPVDEPRNWRDEEGVLHGRCVPPESVLGREREK